MLGFKMYFAVVFIPLGFATNFANVRTVRILSQISYCKIFQTS